MKVSKLSPVSGKINTMDLDITLSQYSRWIDGELIQDVMPNLNKEEREFLITGMTVEEQEQVFSKFREEE